MNLTIHRPMFLKLTHLMSLGSVTMAMCIRLPCLAQKIVTSPVINNRRNKPIPSSVPVKDLTQFKGQDKCSPIVYAIRCSSRSVSCLSTTRRFSTVRPRSVEQVFRKYVPNCKCPAQLADRRLNTWLTGLHHACVRH